MSEFFPILNSGGRRIPWELVESCRPRIERYHGQTLERLAERGGLSEGELEMHEVDYQGQITRPPKAATPPPHGAPLKF